MVFTVIQQCMMPLRVQTHTQLIWKTRMFLGYTTKRSFSKAVDEREDVNARLREATDRLSFAIDGADWVRASADTAFLERDPSDRPPRVHFSVIAGRDACNLIDRALLDVHHLLAQASHSSATMPARRPPASSLDDPVRCAEQLLGQGYQRVKQLRSDVAVNERLLERFTSHE